MSLRIINVQRKRDHICYGQYSVLFPILIFYKKVL